MVTTDSFAIGSVKGQLNNIVEQLSQLFANELALPAKQLSQLFYNAIPVSHAKTFEGWTLDL